MLNSTANFDQNTDVLSSTIENIVPKVLNFSDYNPTEDELSILKRGFKFCITPNKPDFMDLEIDINEFIRKIELTCFFNSVNHETGEFNEECLVKKKSDFIPPQSKDSVLYNMVKHIKLYAEKLTDLPLPKVYSNVTLGERNAVYSLKNNHDIVITSVDKGCSIVIMNRSDYVQCINTILQDTSTYRKLPANVDSKIFKKVKDFTTQFSHCFDKNGKEIEYLTDFDFRTANFYGLIKIHKSKSLINEIKNNPNDSYLKTSYPLDCPIRCITAGVDSPISKLSEILDLILKGLCKKIPSHVRDYVDFLVKMQDSTPDNLDDITFVVCDIVSMYPNINVDLGLRAIRYWLNLFPEEVNSRFDENTILTALELVLTNSTFQFNGDYFSIVKGTATGTTVAPTYATLTIAFLEVELYSRIRILYGDAICKYFIDNWKRFLDDCFILWKKSFGDFQNILNILNNLDPSINFTCEQSDTGLSFLNLYMYKDNGSIKSDIFYKDTDSHDYLPFNSCHPRHIKTNIPGNLARMICTIVQDPDRKEHRLQELKKWLRNAGYPKGLVNNQIKKFKYKDIDFLRNKVVYEKSDNLLVYVQNHNPKNPHVYNYLRNAFISLTSINKYSEIFKNTRLIKSVRQPPNLGRMLQKHNIFIENTPNGVFKCKQKICGTCDYILETDVVNFHNVATNVRTNFNILRPFNCMSKDLIYKIICRGCEQDFYIGETVHLRKRTSGHKFDFRHVEDKIEKHEQIMKVHMHLHDCAVMLYPPFYIVPFYQVRRKTLIARLTVEKYFIRKFNPTLNG